MQARFTIVGLGEALFDIFPDRQVLGGAPLNVAVHAHQLGQHVGARGVVVSRIGQDDLGQQILEELRQRGMTTEFIQQDPDRATGTVYVSFDPDGQPSYDIVDNVAWDWLQFDPDLEGLAGHCHALAFGTLAQRGAEARNAIFRFLNAARAAIRLFDVNLRQTYYDQRTLTRGCEYATALKLNEHELPEVCRTLGITSDQDVDAMVRRLMRRFDIETAALTRGEKGTVLYRGDQRFEGERVSYDAVEGADSVGAGDACTAGLLLGLLRRKTGQQIVDLANHMGAFAASQPGATPPLPQTILDMV